LAYQYRPPLPKDRNALAMEWGMSNHVNLPFRKDDVIARKTIAEQQKGKRSVLVLSVFDYVSRLLESGAEIRPLGRVPFRDVDSDRIAEHPANIACFILHPRKPG
jgi:hypothetical protein